MRQNDFRWKGILASEMGVIVTEQVQYKRPVQRIKAYQVAGRSGTLTADLPPVYEDVVYAPACALKPGANREAVLAWLMGDGEVVFGSMPDHAFRARIADAFDMVAQSEGHPATYYLFSPVFTCNPLRRQVMGEGETVLSAAETMAFNAGNVPCMPLIRVTAGAAGTVKVEIAGAEMEIALSAAGEVTIDTELERVTASMTGVTVTGDMPRLPVGAWKGRILLGSAQVRVTQRMRWV